MVKIATLFLMSATAAAFNHPGLLHTSKDLSRAKGHVDKGEEPWLTDWNLLKTSSRASPTWEPKPVPTVYRGNDGEHQQNFGQLVSDIHAAYQLGIRWHIEKDDQYAKAAINILNAWSSTLKAIEGTGDKYIAAGIYGSQLANAGELLRDYSGWSGSDRNKLKNVLYNVFYKLNHEYLTAGNKWGNGYYGWSSWDFLSLASVQAIGVFNENQDLYDEAINYFWDGRGNGNINKFIYHNWTASSTGAILAQTQEAGRDQNHALLDVQLIGVIMQQAWNQGDDLYKALGNAPLHATEYLSKYNVGQDVPYTWYDSPEGNHTVIAPDGRGEIRPGWERIYAHYHDIKNVDAPWTKKYRDLVNSKTNGVEGGGGNYNTGGGMDDLGFGTLLYRLSA
ncbi:unnamed protein product [Clonostachys byssicola]|uniref:Alginate lyase domain-containing protein n=1 Tax=Clonostachys byssicola TaxID=160290 RepID=A0A9N9USF3_9HYPO|nr:unnamed protein product [Clonostachys byssicola]